MTTTSRKARAEYQQRAQLALLMGGEPQTGDARRV
jgi:hypothetical protein